MSGNIWSGVWNVDTNYKVGNVVLQNSSLFKCVSDHKSTVSFDPQKWQEVKNSVAFKGAWSKGENYKLNDVATTDDGKVYFCLTNHTALANILDSQANWEIVAEGPPRIQIQS